MVGHYVFVEWAGLWNITVAPNHPVYQKRIACVKPSFIFKEVLGGYIVGSGEKTIPRKTFSVTPTARGEAVYLQKRIKSPVTHNRGLRIMSVFGDRLSSVFYKMLKTEVAQAMR